MGNPRLTLCLSMCMGRKLGSKSRRWGSRLTGDWRRPLLQSDHSGLMSPQKAGPERGIKTVHSIRRAVRIDPSIPVPLQGGRKIYEPSSPQTVSKVSQPTTIVGCWLAVLQKPATNCIMAEGVKGVQRGGGQRPLQYLSASA